MTRRGFTAPEFAMVFALIAVAIGFIARGNVVARHRAFDTLCMSNLKQLSTALQMYAADHDYRLPPQPKAWDAVVPYLYNRETFRCPNAPKPEEPEEEPEPPAPEVQARPLWWQPPAEPEGPVESNYLLNPTVQTDDLPTVIIAGDDIPDRHSGRRWIGVRLDGAAGLWPADQWAERIGEVSQYDVQEK